jgi:hypothetical protein
MKVRHIAALSLTACSSGCMVVPDLGRGNSRVNNACIEGRTRAEVLGELGPPTAVTADGSAFLYALPDNDWIFAFGWIAYVVVPLNPHWDVRFVSFDQRGFVQVATGKSERRASLDKLVTEMTVGGWRRW